MVVVHTRHITTSNESGWILPPKHNKILQPFPKITVLISKVVHKETMAKMATQSRN